MVLIYSISVGINSFFRYNKFLNEYELKSKKLSMLKVKQKEIDQKLLDLENPKVWEQLSREKLNMIKPGEVMYRFYNKGNSE